MRTRTNTNTIKYRIKYIVNLTKRGTQNKVRTLAKSLRKRHKISDSKTCAHVHGHTYHHHGRDIFREKELERERERYRKKERASVMPRSLGYGDVTVTYIRRSKIPSRIYAKHQYRQESEYKST